MPSTVAHRARWVSAIAIWFGRCLVKLENLLSQVVTADADFATDLARKVHADADQFAAYEPVKHAIADQQILPDILALLLRFRIAYHAQEYRADAHHHREVFHEIGLQTRVQRCIRQLDGINHHARDAKLLVDAAHHHRFIYRLVLTADEVMVKVDIQRYAANLKRKVSASSITK